MGAVITLFHRQLPDNPVFLKPPSEKTSLIFTFLRLFRVPDGPKYVAETGAVQRPLMAVRRGANLPYFGERCSILAYSSLEQERGILRGYPGMAQIGNGEKEPDSGLFSLSGESSHGKDVSFFQSG